MLIRMYDAAGGVYKGAGPSSSPPNVRYKQDANLPLLSASFQIPEVFSHTLVPTPFRKAAEVRCEMSCVTSKYPFAVMPRAWTIRSGAFSRS